MKIVEIAFTGYPVTDINAPVPFTKMFSNLNRPGPLGMGTGSWIEYDLGPSTFAISNMSSEDWKPSNDGPAIAFEVEDFDSAMARLRDNNVRFALDPFETPVCRMAIITDPDGNSICIHKRHAP